MVIKIQPCFLFTFAIHFCRSVRLSLFTYFFSLVNSYFTDKFHNVTPLSRLSSLLPLPFFLPILFASSTTRGQKGGKLATRVEGVRGMNLRWRGEHETEVVGRDVGKRETKRRIYYVKETRLFLTHLSFFFAIISRSKFVWINIALQPFAKPTR